MRLRAAPLLGAAISLQPITLDDAHDLGRLAEDELARRFTGVPSVPQDGFGEDWALRYVDGWREGTRAGFTIRRLDGAFAGLAGFVHLELERRQGEIGYLVSRESRGQGVATEALGLVTGWGFAGLDLVRIELLIDVENAGSARVAERGGYTHEGVRRSAHFKEGLRADTGVWSRLRTD